MGFHRSRLKPWPAEIGTARGRGRFDSVGADGRDLMNQNELSVFYRGVLLLVVGGLSVALLSSIDQPWAQYARAIGGVVLFLGGSAFIIFATLRQFTRAMNASVVSQPLPPALYLDRWTRVTQLVLVASVLLAVIFVVLLLFVNAPRQCPNWHLPDRRSTPLWVPFFILTVPLLVALTFVVIRWRWVLRKAIASVDYPTTIPIPFTLVVTVLFGSAMAQFPWVVLVTKCWLGPWTRNSSVH